MKHETFFTSQLAPELQLSTGQTLPSNLCLLINIYLQSNILSSMNLSACDWITTLSSVKQQAVRIIIKWVTAYLILYNVQQYFSIQKLSVNILLKIYIVEFIYVFICVHKIYLNNFLHTSKWSYTSFIFITQ